MANRFKNLELNGSPGEQIWVDGQFLKGPISGIARDTEEIVHEFLGEVDYSVINWPRRWIRNSKIFWKIFTLVQLLTHQKFVLPSQFQGTLFQPQLGALIPGPGINQWVVRLHDIFPVTHPEWFRKIDSSQFSKSLMLALEKEAYFICDSETSQMHLLQYAKGFRVNSIVRLCRTPNLSDHLCESCVACKLIKASSLPKQFFLTVGTIEPRKNYKFALEFWKARFQGKQILLVVGRPGWKSKCVQFKLRRNRGSVFWLHDVCDGALKTLYLQSTSYISFSLSEGFDLPAMEAFSLGVPLILSDIPVHRELHERSALFYQTSDELEFNIKTVLKNSGSLL
jgi:glycosyltransferase involved in cell wall biosynthesis